MITLDIQVSGSQIGRELGNDPEELAYALEALAERNDSNLPKEVADSYPYGDVDSVVALLRNIATELEERPAF